MSGAGRKHRAKHLTRQYLDVSGWLGPKDGEMLAICFESPRGQHVRVLLLPPTPSKDADPALVAPPLPASIAGPSDDSCSLEREQLAFLPGKFHKVIWLRIKDIVVVSDGTVTFKPSPEQVENFLKDPVNAGWRERIAAAQLRAEEERVAEQRVPLYSATTQTTTSALTGPQVHHDEKERDEEGESEEGEGERRKRGEDDLVNPNWRSLKHHQQYFYGMEDDTEEEEEEEETQ